MKPRWAEIESENTWLQTEMHDFDEDKEAVEKYGITDTLPAFVFLDKDGNEFLRMTGEVDKDKLVAIINENKER
jgi:thioredoxin-related protein